MAREGRCRFFEAEAEEARLRDSRLSAESRLRFAVRRRVNELGVFGGLTCETLSFCKNHHEVHEGYRICLLFFSLISIKLS